MYLLAIMNNLITSSLAKKQKTKQMIWKPQHNQFFTDLWTEGVESIKTDAKW